MAHFKTWLWLFPMLAAGFAACNPGQLEPDPGTGGGGAGGTGGTGRGGAGGIPPGGAGGLPADFSELRLVQSGGWVPTPAPESECMSYSRSFVLVAANRELGWNFCTPDFSSIDASIYTIDTGTRTLSETEFSSVITALGEVQVGSRGTCGADAGESKLDLTVNGTTTGYVDDFYSCMAAPDGRTFVSYESLWHVQSVLYDLTGA